MQDSSKQYPTHDSLSSEIAYTQLNSDFSHSKKFLNQIVNEHQSLLTAQSSAEDIIKELAGLLSDVDYLLRNVWALDRKRCEEFILPRCESALRKAQQYLGEGEDV